MGVEREVEPMMIFELDVTSLEKILKHEREVEQSAHRKWKKLKESADKTAELLARARGGERVVMRVRPLSQPYEE